MTFASPVAMTNAVKTLVSGNSEAALLALAGEPRGLLVAIRCRKARGAALFSRGSDVAPRKRAEGTSLLQESFTRPVLVQLPGVRLTRVFCHQLPVFLQLYSTSHLGQSPLPAWGCGGICVLPLQVAPCSKQPLPVLGKKPCQDIFLCCPEEPESNPLLGLPRLVRYLLSNYF